MKIRFGMSMLMFMFVASLAFSAGSEQITGTWQGTLKAGPQELRLALHVSSSAGALKATFDSIDQTAYGIPVTSISLEGSKLEFTIDSIHGSYEGTIAADGKSIDGTWTQGQSFPLNFTRATQTAQAKPKPAKPSDIDGAWLGTLDTGMVNLRIVFHIQNTDQGLTATMVSPDQSPRAILVSKVDRKGSQLTLEVNGIGGKFEGTINKERTAIEGTWTQGGRSLPLIVKRVKNPAELRLPRPQNPKGPLPYRQQQVKFEDNQAAIQLAGTLTIPPGKGPFPAVVLIAGSGPNNRNEEVMGHKVFLVLADYLTRKNIVVLRYDKRGIGQSGGNYAAATTADFANDAEAAFNFLRTQPEVNPHEVGLIGHSEGGLIGPIVAARNRNVDFIVMMAGPGVPGAQILVEQTFAISESMGMGPEQARKKADQEQEIMMLVENSKSSEELQKELRAELGDKIPEARLGAAARVFGSPWFRYYVRYDPATALEKVKCAVLAMIGSKDVQVPAKQNLPAIRKALTAGGNKDFQVVEMPGLNHLFQPAKTGSPAEYGQIETTIAPAALEKISGWILKQTAQH
ncbi:MAG: alpha/beta hydrolase [Acidobacteriota bacterium]